MEFPESILQERGLWNHIDFDMCMYGCDYKKSTRLMVVQRYGNEPVLAGLGLSCDGSHDHVSLSGWGDKSKPKRPTKGSAAYPEALARDWANFAKIYLQKYALQ